MQYIRFGGLDIQVSRLGMGCMHLPVSKDRKTGKINGMDEAVELLEHALSRGINYFDTAAGYCDGLSEVAVGRALKSVRRDSVHISTKSFITSSSGDEWRKNLEKALEKLDTPYIDFYHFWSINYSDYEKFALGRNGPLDQAHKALDEGLIRHLSVSSHDTPQGVNRLVDTGEFSTLLVQYNLLNRSYEPCLAHAHEKGMGTLVMGPLAGGRLGTPSELVERATGIAKTAEAALRFVWANPAVSVALSGMKSKKIIDENTNTVDNTMPLSNREINNLDNLYEQNKALINLPCTGCEYCIPCPQNVDIPGIFQAVQWHQAFGLKEPAVKRYKWYSHPDSGEKNDASACTKCGQCETKCPQHIPIITTLEKAHELLTGKRDSLK